MKNLLQFAAIFAAAGCKLNFNSHSIEVDVIDRDAGDVLEEISKFENIVTFSDGLVALALVDAIDETDNPIDEESRGRILANLGVRNLAGLFIYQSLAQQKHTRSWHVSEVPNTCSAFGALCTSRGSKIIEKRGRGRPCIRLPEDFHKLTSNGITREQLVPPALHNFFASIPADRVTNTEPPSKEVRISRYKNLSPEELEQIIARKTIELDTIKGFKI